MTIPVNQQAEQSTLGSILLDDNAIVVISPILKPSDFFEERHQIIYSAMLNLYNRGEGINEITVAQEIHAQKKLGEVGADYFSDLLGVTPTSIHAEYYAKIVKSTSIRRRLISAGEQTISIANEETDPNKCMSKIDQMLMAIQSDMAQPHLITPEQLSEIGATHYGKLRDPQHRVSISTGFEELDFHTGGLFPGDYVILAARAGLGKSQVALQMAQSAGRIVPVLFCPIEMHYKQILDRMVSSMTGIPIRQIRSGGYTDEMSDRIFSQALPQVYESGIYLMALNNDIVDAPQITSTLIGTMARHMKSAYGLGLIVIDYIGLLDPIVGDEKRQRSDQIRHISRRIKVLANSLETPILCVAQINREAERKADKRPQLSELRDCVTGDTMILTTHGTLQRIDSLQSDVVSVNIDGKCENDKGTVYEAGIKPVYEVTTLMGNSIKTTKEHKFFTPSGFKELGELKNGDFVGLVSKVPMVVWRDVNNELSRLLGYLLGDGGLTRTCSPTWTEVDEEVIKDFKQIVSKYFPTMQITDDWYNNANNISITHKGLNRSAGKNTLVNWLRDLGVWGQYSHQRSIPISFLLANEEQICNLMKGLFTADGTIKKGKQGRSVISYSTNSKLLSEQIRLLLLKLGIVSSVAEDNGHYRRQGQPHQRHNVYTINLNGKDTIDRFVEKVGFVGKKQTLTNNMIMCHPRDIANRIPNEAVVHARKRALEMGLSHSKLGYVAQKGKGIEKGRLVEINKILKDDYLTQMIKMDIAWLPIRKIEYLGEEMTYDMTVKRNQNFIANYFVVHNSGSLEEDADSVYLLYRDDYYDTDANKGTAEFWLAKQRQGKANIMLPMTWNTDLNRYNEIGRPPKINKMPQEMPEEFR